MRGVDDRGAQWLGTALSRSTGLEELNLFANGISDAGASCIVSGAAEQIGETILRLDLESNNIGLEEGAVAFARHNLPALQCLILSHNRIGDNGMPFIATLL